MRLFILVALGLLLGGLTVVTLQPSTDLLISGWFFDPLYQPANPANHGFFWREFPAANGLHEAAQWGSRLLAAVLAILTVVGARRKAAAFLLVALLIGPGLITNLVLKDNWGRARPVQVQEFGGTSTYTPALQPTDQCDRNCSFVSGDGAVGFYLHCIFYVVPPAWRRRAFAAGLIGGGVVFGGLRVAMGAHFFSDVLWSGLLMLVCCAAVHAVFYGVTATRAAWHSLFKQAC